MLRLTLNFPLVARESVKIRKVGMQLCIDDLFALPRTKTNGMPSKLYGEGQMKDEYENECFPDKSFRFRSYIIVGSSTRQRRDCRINCGVRLKMGELMQASSLNPKRLHSSTAA